MECDLFLVVKSLDLESGGTGVCVVDVPDAGSGPFEGRLTNATHVVVGVPAPLGHTVVPFDAHHQSTTILHVIIVVGGRGGILQERTEWLDGLLGLGGYDHGFAASLSGGPVGHKGSEPQGVKGKLNE